MFILPAVILTDSPFGILLLQKRVNSLFLLLLTDVEEEFQHKIAVVRQLSFKALHAVDPLNILLLRQPAVQHLLRNLLHPAAVQESKLSRFGNLDEITVQKRSAQLFFRGRGHGGHLKKTRINVFDDLPDGASLSGSAPAFKQHEHRKLMLLKLHLLSKKLFSCFLQPGLKFLLLRLLRRVHFFQHGYLLLPPARGIFRISGSSDYPYLLR